MKKLISCFILLCILLINTIPVFASTRSNKKPTTKMLSRAIKNGDINKVAIYLDAGANPNGVDKIQYLMWGTPIIGMAIDKKENEILDLLLKKGADPNPSTKLLQPLIFATMKRNSYAVEKLLQAGSDRDRTWVGITAEQYAINKGYTEIIEIFSKYDKNGNLIKNESIDINKAINILENTIVGPIFYNYIQGNNITGKPIKVSFYDLSKINKNYADFLSVTLINEGQICIYINDKYKTSSPQAIATLIASATIHQDKKDSINEELYSTALQTTLWTAFTKQNPNLRLENSDLVATLNYYSDYLLSNEYNINSLKTIIESNPAYKSLPKTSPGFSNDDIGLLKDKSLIKQTVENVSKYCKEHNIPSKLKTTCEIIAIFGLVALEAFAIYYSVQANSSLYTSTTYMPINPTSDTINLYKIQKSPIIKQKMPINYINGVHRMMY